MAELEQLADEGITGELPTHKARPPSAHPCDHWRARGGRFDEDHRDLLSAEYGVKIGGRSDR
jgi:hypothetical protein